MQIPVKEEHIILPEIQPITGCPLEDSTGELSGSMKMEQSV